MKSILLALFILILGQTAVAAEHKHHGAHVHGSANLNIAFDDLKGKLNFKSASMGIVGFEHRAVSKKDIKKLDLSFHSKRHSSNNKKISEHLITSIGAQFLINHLTRRHHQMSCSRFSFLFCLILT